MQISPLVMIALTTTGKLSAFIYFVSVDFASWPPCPAHTIHRSLDEHRAASNPTIIAQPSSPKIKQVQLLGLHSISLPLPSYRRSLEEGVCRNTGEVAEGGCSGQTAVSSRSNGKGIEVKDVIVIVYDW
jgi:hypothetical protein